MLLNEKPEDAISCQEPAILPNKTSSQTSVHPSTSKDEHTNSTEDDGNFSNYLRVFSFADSKDWILNGFALIGIVVAGTCFPLMAVVFGKFVTILTNFVLGISTSEELLSDANRYSILFIYIFVAKLVCTYLFTVCISISATRTIRNLRVSFLEHVLRQHVGFFDSSSNGAVATQVTTNGNLINQGIAEKLGLALQSVVLFFASFVVAFTSQWKLALITMCVAPLLIITLGISSGIEAVQEGRILRIYSRAGAMADEVFASIKTVQSFWSQPRFSQDFDAFLQNAEVRGMKKSPNLAVLYSSQFFFIFAGYSLCFWQGIRMYSNGEISESGKVVTVLQAVIMASMSITQLAPHITAITKAISAATELFAIFDKPSHIDPLSEHGIQPVRIEGQLEFCNVVFAYPSRPEFPVLQGLSLSVPSNKTTALVGTSGSGKSTIIGLLERWYEHTSGEIYLDGVEIQDINLQWLRTHVRLVQQEPVLFAGTIYQNIVNGLVGAQSGGDVGEAQIALVKDACVTANAHDFIMKLPQGYQTEATTLSGGQKQRIAIARAVISNPKVLLLDEATSALDPRAEQIVQDALDKVAINRTTLVISHKLKTVQNADNIVVMAHGAVVEQGTHEELYAAGGAYYKLVVAQDLGDSPTGSQTVEFNTHGEVIPTDDVSVAVVENQDRPTKLESDKIEISSQTMNFSLFKSIGILLIEQKDLRLPFFLVGITCLLAGVGFPVQAILFARSLRVLELSGDYQINQGNFYALMFLVLALSMLVNYAILGWVSNIILQVCTRRYRLEIFDSLVRKDLSFFDSPSNSAGALVSRLSAYPAILQDFLGFNLSLVLIAIVNVTASSAVALVYGWKLGLVVIFGGLIPLIVAGYLRIYIEMKLDYQVSKRFSGSAGFAGEAVSAIRTVSSLALEGEIMARYRQQLESIVSQSIKVIMWTEFWFSLSQSIEFLSIALGFLYGTRLVSTREYTTSQFYTIFAAMLFGGQAAASLFAYTTSISKVAVAANYILWLRSIPPSIAETDENKEKGPKRDDSIELTEVEFSYPQRRASKALQGVTLAIKPGQFAAFVGASGCGKSTLINLLERFYDPSSGIISMDGNSISNFSPRLYRRNMALVQQEPILYQGSIRKNIALGLETEATDEQIEEACRQANILTFIQSLPNGFETSCGSRGLQLSGGQRQRIAIARALIRKPQILLLDEATSALDTESEKVVQEALNSASVGRTTIAVAHRLSTIKNADIIFVFADGRLAEQGTHSELIKQGGLYASMCISQTLAQG